MLNFKTELLNKLDRQPDFTWLNIIGKESIQTYTVSQLVLRVYDFCTFYREKGIIKEDVVLIILKESLDLYASFIAGIIYGALPGYYFYPSPKQSKEAFLKSIEDLVRYNKVRLVVSFSDVIEVIKEKNALKNDYFVGSFEHSNIKDQNSTKIEKYFSSVKEAFLQFSSGTTGAKKAVKITSEALLNQIEAYMPFVRYSHNSSVASWLPHYHDMGLIACMLIPFLKDIPIYMMSPFEWVKRPQMLFEAITKFRCTHAWLPNFALGHMCNSISEKDIYKYNLNSIKRIICCSEPVLCETVDCFTEKFKPIGLDEKTILNCYAMAENTFAITSTKKGPQKFIEVKRDKFQECGKIEKGKGGKRIASVGIPLKNIELRVKGKNGKEKPENYVGEIWIKSDCMLEGYYSNPIETEKSFSDGWFNTGDLGFFHDGELFITGREKDIIIVGGENIYPEDIELILNEDEHLQAGRNVVFGVKDERIGTERIVVLAEVKEGIESARFDSSFLRRKIFNHLNVSVSDFISLPHMTLIKSTAGKISRYLNKMKYIEGGFSEYMLEEIPHFDIDGSEKDEVVIIDIVKSVIPGRYGTELSTKTPLISSGLIDSFAFMNLIISLEESFKISIPENAKEGRFFENVSKIRETVDRLCNDEAFNDGVEDYKVAREENLLRFKGYRQAEEKATIKEWIINHLPFKINLFYKLFFKILGIKIGKGVKFNGRVRIKLRGKKENIRIGDNVIFGDNVDIRNRENGKLIFHEYSEIGDNVRLVAAREGYIEIGQHAIVGRGSSINSGGIVRIGKCTLIAQNVSINASDHGIDRKEFIISQPYNHGVIDIASDVWISAGVTITNNTTINEGAVIGANSVVYGEIPPFAVCMGIPAKVIKYR